MAKGKAKSSQAYAASLAEANKFDLSALPVNREGNYTSGQRVKLMMTLISMFIAALICFGLSILFIYAGQHWFPKADPFADWKPLLLSIILYLTGIGWIYAGVRQLLSSWWPLFKDYVDGNLAIEQGQVKKDYDDKYYKTFWHRLLDLVFGLFFQDDERYRFNMFSGTHFYLTRDNRFIVSQKGYNAIDEEVPHVLYFAPRSNKLINIEPAPR
jgi:hypothetical protein